jgi:hypothetical protein
MLFLFPQFSHFRFGKKVSGSSLLVERHLADMHAVGRYLANNHLTDIYFAADVGVVGILIAGII